jgi:amino acid adenylation domain-containing protein
MTSATAKDAYPLSSMQQGMLFHSISAPATDVYVQQLSACLRGPLDVSAFERAWNEMLRRHAVTRTAFAWRGLPEPLQVVGERVRLPLELLDWRDLPKDGQAQRLAGLCAAERIKGFDLGRAPLMRIKLIRLSDDENQLVWTWHHIILDAWSVPIIVEEFFSAYDALASGREVALDPPPRYRDFVAWQRSADLHEAETFWRKELDGVHEPTPSGIGRPAGVSSDDTGYGLEFIEVPEEEVALLRAFARRSRLTLNTIVQGVWALLLSRYSGREDVVFGVAVAGRPAELQGVERMVGLLINTLPLRVRVSPSQRISEWLEALQRRQAEARRYEQTPLIQLQGWSPLGRGTQLFETLLVVENLPLDTGRMRGGGVELGAFDFIERANFPLTVLMEIRTRSRLGVGYDRNRFDRESMVRMLGHLRTLMTEIARDSQRSLDDLDYMVEAERRQLVEAWSRGPHAGLEAEGRPEIAIHRLFEAVVNATPDALAAVFATPDGDVRLTYAELNARANRFARFLQSRGAGVEDRVVVCMGSSLGRLAAILGIMKAGAAYVPLDDAVPPARLNEMIADCGARLVIAQAPLAGALSAPGAEVIALDGDDDPGLGERGNDLQETAGPHNLAYIIYTSGSTGRPKGVAIEHRSLRHLVNAQVHAFRIDRGSRVLQFASLSFDASVSEIFTALLAGASLYMAPRHLLVPSRDLLALMRRWAITTVTFPPSVLARLPASDLPSLKTLVAAGEACSAEIVTKWAPGRLFLNAYGPTEVTVCATVAEVRPDGTKPSIGFAIGDAHVHVLDQQLRPVAIGVAGELCVGGPGVARGYWGRPDQTVAAFIHDPFSGDPDARLYRTGDLVRFLPSGELEFLGRRDEQVKVRGFRIEPGEIEAALRTDSSVQDAVVVTEGSADERRLVAYLMPKNGPRAEWWPSIAEYFVYDELAYHAMTSDERRNESYRAAIREKVRGKVVLEVGTGPEALLSRFCAEAGARKVYAIEMLPDSHARACARVRELGLDDRIEVILGDAMKVDLPEPADVCVSEIVGAIGGCEGAAVIMNGVRRLLAGDAQMIPARSTTMYAPVQLPDALREELAFAPLPARYVEKIFGEIGYPFDLRLCVKGVDRSHLLAEPRVFEDLDFRDRVDAEVRHAATHVIERDGHLDGFLVWLSLDTGAGERIDILEHEHCWLPVFFPAFGGMVDVAAGDRIDARSGAVLRDGLHPDYFVEGSVLRRGREPVAFRYDSPRQERVFRATPFYRELFRDGKVPRLEGEIRRERFDSVAVKQRLRGRLPDYMVPDVFAVVEQFPLLPSGKVDRRGLASAARAAIPDPPREIVPPRNEAEHAVARIWRDVLQAGEVGRETNFFDHGGHSLLLLRVQDRVREDLGVDVSVADLFAHPTVESLAGRLSRSGGRSTGPMGSHQRAAARQQAMESMAGRRPPRVASEDEGR